MNLQNLRNALTGRVDTLREAQAREFNAFRDMLKIAASFGDPGAPYSEVVSLASTVANVAHRARVLECVASRLQEAERALKVFNDNAASK